MSQPILNLQSPGVWSQVYNESREAVLIGEHNTPIPAFEIGFLIDKHIIAVRCLSLTAKAHWWHAGRLTQQFQVGTGGAASPLPIVTGASRRLRLNRTELIRFPRLTSNYSLVFESAYWIRDMRFTVWEYSGPESDTTEEMIEVVQIGLVRIEDKIDALS